jgi:hypothetical protein
VQRLECVHVARIRGETVLKYVANENAAASDNRRNSGRGYGADDDIRDGATARVDADSKGAGGCDST